MTMDVVREGLNWLGFTDAVGLVIANGLAAAGIAT